MSQVSGIIQSIESRKVSNGTKTAYNIIVAGQSYGAGLYAPKAKEGDYVTFTAEQNGNFLNVERGTLKVGKAPAGEAKAATSAAVKQAVGGYDARQDAISRQAASNTAIAWVTLLHTVGALPAAKSKGDHQAVMDTFRREYEKEFYQSNTGNVWKDINPTKTVAADDEVAEDSADLEDAAWE